jgi:methylmalonyl-CoA mutase N-terminal domain/subunit
MGGALAAVEQGFQANEIHENAFRIQRDVEAKRKIVVGVNEYVDEEAPPEGLHQHDLAVGERASERIRALRARRDASAWEASMSRLDAGARGDANMIPLIIDAVENYATLGEICARLRNVWGEMHEATQL